MIYSNATIQRTIPQIHIAITGGPGTGKTSIIRRLAELGESVIAEAAVEVRMAEREAGVAEPWKHEGFDQKILVVQEVRQKEAASRPAGRVFFDRTPLDTITYNKLAKGTAEERIKSSVRNLLLDSFYFETVFLIESHGEVKQGPERHESEEESLQIEKALEARYKKYSFNVVRIGPGTVEDRANKILEVLNTQHGK